MARLGVPSLDRLAADLGLRFETEFWGETPPAPGSAAPDFTAFYVVHLPDHLGLERALDLLQSLPEVESADPIGVLPVSRVPNDSLWAQSTWYFQPPARHDVHAPEAWDVTTGDTSIVVAVLDTGVLPYHPDLGGSVAGQWGQMWRNAPEVSGTPGVDDDGNGFIDDTWGWDFVEAVGQTGIPNGEDVNVQDPDPNDFAGHGTAVAGMVGALTDNGIGISGTAWDVRIMALRMGWASFASPLGEVDMLAAARAIRYATLMGADIINCSFSTLDLSGLYAAARAAADAGVIIVCAAGNGGQVHELQDREDVIAVAATDAADQIAGFSNLGRYVDVAAPGAGLISTFRAATGGDSIGLRQPTYIGPLDGTSFASPIVAGALALIQSDRKARGLDPLTPLQAILRVHETADDIADLNPGVSGYGGGRLNLERALLVDRGSNAYRIDGSTVGAPIVQDVTGGAGRAFLPLSTSRLLITRGVDTIEREMSLPAVPVGHAAAADLGGGAGIGLFVALSDGSVGGYNLDGDALAGWPVADVTPLQFTGPALGDLDGDGVLEIVSATREGLVYAWQVDGSVVTGFPASAGASVEGSVALADLDGVPGVEIVVTSVNGLVRAIKGDGTTLAGFPRLIAASPSSPVIARLSADGTPSIVVAAGAQLRALTTNGSTRFSVALLGTVNGNPVLADLDGDGFDEIVVVTMSPHSMAVFDTAGMVMSARGWPRTLAAQATGDAVAGQLRSAGGTAIELLVPTTEGLQAFSDSAVALPYYPRPGVAGVAPTLAELDAPGTTVVLGGAGADSLLYFYDAGANTAAGPVPWPTARGNFARTASTTYAPVLPALDDQAPAVVSDMAADSIGVTGVRLSWTAPGDDGMIGQAASYELRVATHLLDSGNFATAAEVPGVAPPAPAGNTDVARVTSLEEGVTHFFALITKDEAGNASALSNVAVATTGDGAPGRVLDLAGSDSTEASVTLQWTASGDDGPLGRPVSYRLHGSLAAIDDANFESAAITVLVAANAAVGEMESAVVAGLDAGRTYYFAIKARDDGGADSKLSNVARIATRGGGRDLGPGPAVASRFQPSRLPVQLDWQTGGVVPTVALRIGLYDLGGRLVRTLALGREATGTMQWNGRDEDGHLVPAGIYFARLTGGSFHAQTRVVLLP